MTRQEFSAVVMFADSKQPEHVAARSIADDSPLDGCALPGFQPVAIPIAAAARWLLNGAWEGEAFQECQKIARYRIQLAD